MAETHTPREQAGDEPGPTQERGADGGAVEDHEVLDSEVA